MNQTLSMTILAALLLPVVGCRRPTPPPPPDPNNWKGEASIDPAGDLQKLQGKWERISLGKGPNKWPEAWIVFQDDTITFHSPLPNQPDFKESYRFVLDSVASPKIMRSIEWLGPGQPLPGHEVPSADWYSLDGNTLTLWDKWTNYGEKPKITYHRAKDKK